MIISIIGVIVVVFVILACLGAVNTDPFEQKFIENFGRTPEEFIKDKLENGSDIDAIEYLFDINAAKIYHDYGIEMRPFDYYYKGPRTLSNNYGINIEKSKIEPIQRDTKKDTVQKNKTKIVELKKTDKPDIEIPLKEDKELFELLFKENYNHTPIEYIIEMIEDDYTKNEISWSYLLKSNFIKDNHRVKPIPFSNYYDRAVANNAKCLNENTIIINNVNICRREMIHTVGDVSFGKYFYNELNSIFLDNDICGTIQTISSGFNDVEFTENSSDDGFVNFKNKILPELFSEYNLNTNINLAYIIKKSEEFGYNYTSSIVSVYYLIRMLQLFNLSDEDKTVNGLAKAIKKLEQ